MMITWSSFQSVNVPIINDVRNFTVRRYFVIPNSYFESFSPVCGMCDPQTCVWFPIPFVCGLPMRGLCFVSTVPVIFGGGSFIVITYI